MDLVKKSSPPAWSSCVAVGLCVFVFACHFSHMKGVQWSGLILVLAGLVVMLTKAGTESVRDFPRPVLAAYLLWGGCAFASASWSAVPLRTVELSFTDVLLPLFSMLGAYAACRRRSTGLVVSGAWAGAVVCLACVTVLALILGQDDWLKSGNADVLRSTGLVSFYPGPGLQSTFVVLGAPLLYAFAVAGWFSRRASVFLGVCLALCAVATFNRMTFVSAGGVFLMGMSYASWKDWRGGRGAGKLALRLSATVCVMALICVGVVVSTLQRTDQDGSKESGAVVEDSFSQDARLTMWRYWKDVALQSPLIGHGFGKPAAVASHDRNHPLFPKIDHPEITHPHNLILSLWVQVGVIGVAAFLALLATIFLEGKRRFAGKSSPGAGLALMMLVLAFVLKNLTDDFFDRIVCNLLFVYVGLLLGLLAGEAAPGGDDVVAESRG